MKTIMRIVRIVRNFLDDQLQEKNQMRRKIRLAMLRPSYRPCGK